MYNGEDVCGHGGNDEAVCSPNHIASPRKAYVINIVPNCPKN